MVGKTLGHYEILEPLGKGGMGEVYRARDTTLKREVAIKVLPEDLALDPDRLARLEREAHLLAAINHPNIATIHSLDQVEDTRFLVLELVKGESLEQRLAKGPLPTRAALDLCKQIAEALEAAHSEGIIHRDLKPANVLITPNGRAKVLDFGLAKSFEGNASPGDMSQSPTLTVAGTQAGVILGTAPYMSPEQVRGLPLDKRVDIWAFGCVLYESLTASRAFARETIADTLAAIIESEPNFGALPAATPPMVAALVKRCLRKDPDRRLHDIADARIEIEESLNDPATKTTNVASAAAGGLLPFVPWVVAVAVAVIALGWIAFSDESRTLRPAYASFLEQPNLTQGSFGSVVAISPDGSRLAFVGVGDAGERLLYTKTLEGRGAATPIAGTESASSPFFSPGGEWIGYFDERQAMLMKVAAGGGTPLAICPAAGSSRGASWGPNDTIVFTNGYTTGLFLVSADGGEVRVLTTPDADALEKSHRLPQFLPGGGTVLFTVGSARLDSFDDADIMAVDVRTGEIRTVLRGAGSDPHYVAATGHLLFARDGVLMAVPFDPDDLPVTDTPTAAIDNVVTSPESGPAAYGLSETGTLVYVAGGPDVYNREIVRVALDGTTSPMPNVEPGLFNYVVTSPDGTRLALTIGAPTDNVWQQDLERGFRIRMTREWDNIFATWIDETRVAVAHRSREIRVVPADGSGSGPGELLWTSPSPSLGELSASSDQGLVFTSVTSQRAGDIYFLPLDGGDARPLVESFFNETNPRISPNGRFFAYESDEGGRSEVYVRNFPAGDGIQVIGAGTDPRWSADERTLFFRDGEAMMAVTVAAQTGERFGTPEHLFDLDGLSTRYDVSVDEPGFFVVLDNSVLRPSSIDVVFNFFEELREIQ